MRKQGELEEPGYTVHCYSNQRAEHSPAPPYPLKIQDKKRHRDRRKVCLESFPFSCTMLFSNSSQWMSFIFNNHSETVLHCGAGVKKESGFSLATVSNNVYIPSWLSLEWSIISSLWYDHRISILSCFERNHCLEIFVWSLPFWFL